MGWKAATECFCLDSRSLIGYDKQNQCFSSFRMIHGAGAAFIDSWDRGNFRFHLRNTHPRSSDFQKCSFASFDPQITFFVLARQVTRPKPTTAEDATGFFSSFK